jgi:hypothetical protein
VSLIDGESGQVIATKVTGPDGRYEVPVKTNAEYILIVSADGYAVANLLLASRPDGISLVNDLGRFLPAGRIDLTPEGRPSLGKRDARRKLPETEAMRRYVFEDLLIESLPLAGIRSIDSLALLLPGVFPAPETLSRGGPGLSPGLGTAGQFSVNGLRSRENNFTVDGSDNNDEDVGVRRQGFVTVFPQTIESLSEFQVITALGEARFGRAIGGQINAVSKIGGNGFHGDVYGFFTNSRLKARDFFDLTAEGYPSGARRLVPITADGTLQRPPVSFDLGGLESSPIQVVEGLGFQPNPSAGEDPSTRTQVGFAFGGPISRKGTFLFASFERQAVRASKETHFSVPTAGERRIFQGRNQQLFATDRLGNPDPSVELLPTSLPGNGVFSLYPFPNNPLGPYGGNTFTEILPADATGNLFSIKVDRRLKLLGTSQFLTGRYNFTDENSIQPTVGKALFSSVRPKIRTQNAVLILSSNLLPSLSNNFRMSYGRTIGNFGEVRNSYLIPSEDFPDQPLLLNAPYLMNVTRPDGSVRYVSVFSEEGQRLVTPDNLNSKTVPAEFFSGALGEVSIAGFSSVGLDVIRHKAAAVQQLAATEQPTEGGLSRDARKGLDRDRDQNRIRATADGATTVSCRPSSGLAGLLRAGSRSRRRASRNLSNLG